MVGNKQKQDGSRVALGSLPQTGWRLRARCSETSLPDSIFNQFVEPTIQFARALELYCLVIGTWRVRGDLGADGRP